MRSIVGVLVVIGCGSKSKPAEQPPPPAPAPVGEETKCTGDPPSPEHVCVQDCGPPVAKDGDPPPGYRWLSAEDAKKREQFGCPICLPPTARIATPDGDRPVSELGSGARIYTIDEQGRRVIGHVMYVAATPIGGRHQLVRITLDDGRVVAASGGHPDEQGRPIAQLRQGDRIAGGKVSRVDIVPFAGDRTWDVLPSGSTGAYIVDGVVLRSSFTGVVAPR